MLAFQKCGSW